MSRILFAWELGANLGHVAQLAPIAARLEEEGHELLFAVKDMAAAHQVLRRWLDLFALFDRQSSEVQSCLA